MSKNYFLVQTVWPPNFLVPRNADIVDILYNKVDEFIKAGKLTMSGVFGDQATPLNKDFPNYYRLSNDSHCISMHNGTFSPTEAPVIYRLFIDEAAANEFIALQLAYGAVTSSIVTEADLGGKVPADFWFPTETRVGQRIWPGYPDFVYNGTYPEPGPADATPDAS